jgi:hypothetical protein
MEKTVLAELTKTGKETKFAAVELVMDLLNVIKIPKNFFFFIYLA